MVSMVSVSSGSQWTIREQLVLASAVQQSGDKNWVSVSRAIKPLMEDVRPTDYFSQKNCALQYAAMLDKVPNRRKRRASEDGTETTEQLIVRELSEKRINELNKTLAEIRSEYTTLSKDIGLLERGELDDRRVPELWERLNSDLAGLSSPSKITAFGISNKPITILPLSDPQTVTSAKENAILTTKQTELVSSAAVNAEVTVTPNTSLLHEKIATVKKEHQATDTESPLVRFHSLADDKVLSPMQTPLPTPSGQPLSANLHIILQERNKAADNLLTGSNNSTQLKTTLTKTLNDTSANTSLSITPPQFSSSPITALSVPQSTTNPSPSAVSKPPVKESPNASLSKSVPKMAYLSKSQAVGQPPKGGVLQSLVSTPGNPLPTTATVQPSPVTTSPSVAATSIPLTTISSHVVSPLATASVTAPLIKTSPVRNTATLATSQVGKPLVIVQPVSSQVSTNISPSTSIAVSSPVKSTSFVTTSQDVSRKPSTDTIAQKKPVSGHTTASVIKLETSTLTSPKSEAVKDIKSLLALPPVTSKQPVKIGEATQPVKQATEHLTTVKQDSFKPLTTPIKAEPEIIDILSDALITPVSSPPSAVRTATLTPPPVVMETQDAEPEDDTPTKFKRGHSILKRSLLARSRKRKHEDEGPSVESTDTEEDGPFSQTTSTMSSPAPSQCGEMDADTLRSHKQWKKGIMIVWRHAAQHKFANFFLHRVREEDAPGYMDVILCPTDLSSIKRKVECGQIKNDIEFQREMLLMFQNAFMYNSSDHEVYDIAQSMKRDVMENLQTYLATQAQLQLIEDPVPTKTLRGRRSDRDQSHEDFSPAMKKRKTRMDDRD